MKGVGLLQLTLHRSVEILQFFRTGIGEVFALSRVFDQVEQFELGLTLFGFIVFDQLPVLLPTNSKVTAAMSMREMHEKGAQWLG